PWASARPPPRPPAPRAGGLLPRPQLEPKAARPPADPLTEPFSVLAGLVSASVQGRVAFGPGASLRVCRLGDKPDLDHLAWRGSHQPISRLHRWTANTLSRPEAIGSRQSQRATCPPTRHGFNAGVPATRCTTGDGGCLRRGRIV